MSLARARLASLMLLFVAACRGNSLPPADRSDGALPIVHAARVATDAIRVDGKLDEPAWKTAGSTGAFVGPGDGRASTRTGVNAVARVAWDDANLYVGIEVHERDPVSPFQRTEIDPHLWERASAVELMLQPGDPGDNRDYYEVQVDIGGAVWDTHFDDYNQPITPGPNGQLFGRQEWSADLKRAAKIDPKEGRYTIELAWPFRSIAGARTAVPPRPGDTWRLNLYSFRSGQSDAMAWSPILGKGNFHRASRFGRLTFAP